MFSNRRTWGLWLFLLMSLVVPVAAKERQVFFVIPAPQGKFPPPWTDSIRVSVPDEEEVIQDHRHFKKGAKEFRGVLAGGLRNKDYTLEVLCLGKEGKLIAVFQQKIKIKPSTKKLELKALNYVQTLGK